MPAICSPLTSWRQTPAAGRGCCVNLRATLQNSVPRVEQVATLADPIHFAVVDQQRGKAVGSLALMRIDIAHGVVEVGHVHFSPLLSRTAMATEAHWLLMQYVFDTLGYRRYEWKCNSLNIPSARAARRLGFQYEGRFRRGAGE
ncbi:GNAT family N-acetyltransferase [Klebsiella pneumoniae]|nr:GNAT family N-acetyltransferase [Klebsiella pneumoniae]MBD3703973.1 GNAT family N-acetyltransferase [Klebsiella pneumoniae]MBD3719792.1 GNAT family N-acetyltransferase [Klebsiella pneumoniae]